MRSGIPATWLLTLASCTLLAAPLLGQSIGEPWTGHGHDPQHTATSRFAAQPLNRIHWQTPVDLNPQYSGTELLIHYGSPLVTRGNTVLLPVKTGATGGFRVEARSSANGSLLWTQTSDYSLPMYPSGSPAYNWTPSYNLALTPKNRLYFPGAGGTVYYRDAPDAATGNSGQIAFYGLSAYHANQSALNAAVQISTPITADRYGNIYFGFYVNSATTPTLTSGIARIDQNGTGSWVAATALGDAGTTQIEHNCGPALSNDEQTLYVAVSNGGFGAGYLAAADSRTLAPMAKVRLKDAASPTYDAYLTDDSSGSPTIGPDGDVYFGVIESPLYSNHFRGWLLHFDKTLTQTKTPGLFGWDDTPSIVPAAMVPSYTGNSSYLLLSKYNNYVEGGGDGVNKVAILDPNASMVDPTTQATVMKEIAVQAGVTPDSSFPNTPGAVREWCINTAAVDPIGKYAIVHSEDGSIYRWNLVTQTLDQTLNLTAGIGSAYTPTVIGSDGTVYVIANGTLFAVGQ